MKINKLLLIVILFSVLFYSEPILSKNMSWGTDPFKLSNYQARQTRSLFSKRAQKQDIEIEQTLFGPEVVLEEQKGPKFLDQLQLQDGPVAQW